MWHECPNCREGLSYFRLFRTPAWGSFRCPACGSILGISFRRRILAVLIWVPLFIFMMECLGLWTWGRLFSYGFMLFSIVSILYLFEHAVLIERRAFTCRRCGYDLQGLPEPRCPECGTPFDPAERERILARINTRPPQPRYRWVAVIVVVVLAFAVAWGFVAWQNSNKAARPATTTAAPPASPTAQGK